MHKFASKLTKENEVLGRNIRLEVGKFYRNGGDEVRNIVEDLGGDGLFRFVDEYNRRYKADGCSWYEDSYYDLIEEVEGVKQILKVEEPPIKVELGKSYKNVQGKIIKIIDFAVGKNYPFAGDDGGLYNDKGQALALNQQYHDSSHYGELDAYFNDLVEEVKAEEPMLKLEVGKSYKNGRGDVREIIKYLHGTFAFPFVDQYGFKYTDYGRRLNGPPEVDLVEEVKPEKPTLKLEVGKSYRNSAGEVREIIGKEDGVDEPLFVDELGFIYKEDGLCNVALSSLHSPLVYSTLVEEVGAEEVKVEEPTTEEVKEPNAETILVPKGRVLQFRKTKDSEWEDIHTCAGDFEYRVKPNRETVVRYANVHSEGDAGSSRKVSISPKWEAQTRIAVLKITTTFDGDKPNLPTVEVISHEDALKMEAQNEVAK